MIQCGNVKSYSSFYENRCLYFHMLYLIEIIHILIFCLHNYLCINAIVLKSILFCLTCTTNGVDKNGQNLNHFYESKNKAKE